MLINGGATLTMNGGNINDNEAGSYGGGIMVGGPTGRFNFTMVIKIVLL